MCKDVKITTKQLTKAMDAEYQKLVQQVKDAVNLAPDRTRTYGTIVGIWDMVLVIDNAGTTL